MRKLLTFLIALASIIFAVCSPAHAYGCRGWPQLIGGNGCNSSIASALPIVTNIGGTGAKTSGNGTTTYTYSTVALGTSFATRRIILAPFNNFITTSISVVSCTIAGVACDVVQNNGTGAGDLPFLSANIGTTGGTSAAITITFSGNNFAAGTANVYSVDNSNLASPTPVTGYALSGSTTSNSATTSSTAGGFEIVSIVCETTCGTTPALTSTETFTTDGSNASVFMGHANNISTNAASSAAFTWSTNAVTALAIGAWR